MVSATMMMDDDQLEEITGGTGLAYRVKPGDTLEEIAQRYRVPVDEIKKWNNSPEIGELRMDQILKIQSKDLAKE